MSLSSLLECQEMHKKYDAKKVISITFSCIISQTGLEILTRVVLFQWSCVSARVKGLGFTLPVPRGKGGNTGFLMDG